MVTELWYMQTVEYYSALKRNDLSSHEKTWKDHKYIFLSERSQSEKTTYCMCNSLEKANYEEVKRMVVTKD